MQGLVRVMLMGFLVVATAPAWADESRPPEQTAEEPGLDVLIGLKLARGIANFGLGWVEVPKQIYLVGRNEGWLAGTFRGPVDGLGMFGARTIAGMYEIFSFPFPIPPHYQPLMQPEFVWQPDPAASALPPSSLSATRSASSREDAAPLPASPLPGK
ncbi:MAG: exosortase system-associated protein, TIGR04073 family [Nitrospirae bacterium]|nr:MAG: exosortase system-associated protein, TIGR04073 family [Nitrospirota bacterium]